MEVRRAREAELSAVMTILDAALLETAAADVRDAVEAGDVLVAASAGRVLGVLVLDPDGAADGARVDAVAVRPGRRDRGIGRALVGAAAERHGRLVAGFDTAVRPFWASLGFVIEPAEEPGRFRGVLDQPPARG